MNMDTIKIEKLKKLRDKIAEEKGSLALFAVAQRDDVETWDIIVSGQNINDKDKTELDDIINLIRNVFPNGDITIFSRLILLNPTDDFVKNLKKTGFADKEDTISLSNVKIDSFLMKRVIIFNTK